MFKLYQLCSVQKCFQIPGFKPGFRSAPKKTKTNHLFSNLELKLKSVGYPADKQPKEHKHE